MITSVEIDKQEDDDHLPHASSQSIRAPEETAAPIRSSKAFTMKKTLTYLLILTLIIISLVIAYFIGVSSVNIDPSDVNSKLYDG